MKIENNRFSYSEKDLENAINDYYGEIHGYYVTPSVMRSFDDCSLDLEGNFMKAYYRYYTGEVSQDELDEVMKEFGVGWFLQELEDGMINTYGIDDFFYEVFLEPEYSICDLTLKEFYEKYNGYDPQGILIDYFNKDCNVLITEDAVISLA